MARAALLLTLLLLAAPAGALAGGSRTAVFPARGILITGQSLAGVHLGATPADVEATWGTSHVACHGCPLPTWFYFHPGLPVGAAVVFDRTHHAVAVFTLGQPRGWRTQKGLTLGADIHELVAMYDANHMAYKGCVGFTALSVQQGSVVTSILTQAEQVYGFALTTPDVPVCV